MVQVILLNDTNFKHVPTLENFQCWVDKTFEMLPKKISKNFCEICITIVDKETSQNLNEIYREKKYPTNVLSFMYDAIPGMPQESIGDLAICADIVEAEAKAGHKKLESHWAHLTVHGVLHLMSYDHIEDEDAMTMEGLESEILSALGFESPY